MATIINYPTPGHGDVTYPKLRVLLDSLQFTLDSLISTLAANKIVITNSSGAITTGTINFSATGTVTAQTVVTASSGDTATIASSDGGGAIYLNAYGSGALGTINGRQRLGLKALLSDSSLFISTQSGSTFISVGVNNTEKFYIDGTTAVLSNALTINPVSSQLVLGGAGSTNTVTLTAPTPGTASRLMP